MRMCLCGQVSSADPSDSTDPRCYEAVSSFFAALASPVRSAIVHRLSRGPLTVGGLVDSLGVSQPLVSQHLRQLRTVEIVSSERVGRQIVYSLTDEHVAHVFADAYHHTEEKHDNQH